MSFSARFYTQEEQSLDSDTLNSPVQVKGICTPGAINLHFRMLQTCNYIGDGEEMLGY